MDRHLLDIVQVDEYILDSVLSPTGNNQIIFGAAVVPNRDGGRIVTANVQQCDTEQIGDLGKVKVQLATVWCGT